MKKCSICIFLILLLGGCGSDISQNNINQSSKANEDNIIKTVLPAEVSNHQNTNNQKDITTPIVIEDILMGGVIDGKWTDIKELVNSKKVELKDFEYNVYLKDTKIGTTKGSLPIEWHTGEILNGDYEQGYDTIEFPEQIYEIKNKMTELRPDIDINIDPIIALKNDWNLFPRKYKVQDPNQKQYIDMVKGILKDQGIENANVIIKQILRVDLDGDGTEEVLINANNTKDNKFTEVVKKGDYAIVVLRKIINGKVENQIIEIDITDKIETDSNGEEIPSIFRVLFNIDNIADLDGDGTMEVIIKNWYYEGCGWGIYKLIDNKLDCVAANGIGA